MSEKLTAPRYAEDVKYDKVLSVLMVGQSNMSGRGNLEDVEPIYNDDCFMLRMARWIPMIEPINNDRPERGVEYPSGVSLGASFADSLSRYTGGKVGMIPAAYGGSSIRLWEPGSQLFDYAVMLARLAMRISDFGGIIWHQGESDAAMDMKEYKERLREVIISMRRELSAEELPFILGEVPTNASATWRISKTCHYMNRVIHELAGELPNVGVATSRGLTLKADGIHFDSVSLRTLGERYFEEYRKIVERQNEP